MSTYNEFIHYGETVTERAARQNIDKSCLENRKTPLCLNGNFHAVVVRDKKKVTCPKCLAKLQFKKIKTLEIHAKEWFDKVNGNSYFAGRIIINGDIVLKMPFQYGYGDYYLQSAYELLRENGFTVGEKYCDFSQKWLRFDGIPARAKALFSKTVNCKNAEVKQYGKGD